MERRQQEDERERVQRDDQQGDDGERKESGAVTRELLLLRDRAPGEQAVSHDEPAAGREAGEDQQAQHGPVRAGARLGRRRP